MLPLILLPIIALGGGLTPPGAMRQPMPAVAKIFPSRWALEANLLLESAQAKHGVSVEGDPEQNGCDLAEVQFPKPKSECLNPAPSANAEESQRTPLSTSFAVLSGMLVFWIGTALIFLKMRDIQ